MSYGSCYGIPFRFGAGLLGPADPNSILQQLEGYDEDYIDLKTLIDLPRVAGVNVLAFTSGQIVTTGLDNTDICITGIFNVSFYAKRTIDATQSIIDSGANHPYVFDFLSSDRTRVLLKNSGGTVFTGGQLIPLGINTMDWHHYRYTGDGSKIDIFIDKAETPTGTINFDGNFDGTSLAGQTTIGNTFDGRISLPSIDCCGTSNFTYPCSNGEAPPFDVSEINGVANHNDAVSSTATWTTDDELNYSWGLDKGFGEYRVAAELPMEGGGTFDFSWDSTGGTFFWLFPDGTTSTLARPTRVVAEGSVYLILEPTGTWSGGHLNDNLTTGLMLDVSNLPALDYALTINKDQNLVGDLSDLPELTYWLNLFQSPGITGDLEDLPPLTNYLDLAENPLITGDLANLPAITYQMALRSCPLITGDYADLPPITHYLNLGEMPLLTGNAADLPEVDYFLGISGNSNVSGQIMDLPPVSYYFNANNCPGLTGSCGQFPPVTSYLACANNTNLIGGISAISPDPVDTLNLGGCINITGSIHLGPPSNWVSYLNCANIDGFIATGHSPIYLDIRGTAVVKTDLELTITRLDGHGRTNGTLRADDGLPTIDDPAAITSVANLRGKGWVVEVNE